MSASGPSGPLVLNTTSVDPEQTVPTGATGSTPFASVPKLPPKYEGCSK